MRHILLVTSLSISLPALAQEAPRVLFCSGPCFAVDATGTRTPVTKGSPIAPGQRLETGPGAYLQVKMERVGLGLGENTRLRFDRGALVLDQGRMRAVTGIGTGVVRPPQIRTPDGDLALGAGDIEIKKTAAPGTLVKVNAGDAVLRSSAGEIKLPNEGVQSLQGGRLSVAPSTVGREMVLATVNRSETSVPGAPSSAKPPIVRPIVVATSLPPVLRVIPDVLRPNPINSPLPPLVTRVMNTSLTDPTTGTTAKLTDFVRTTALTPPTTPTVTTLTTTPKVIAPIITTPTLRPRTGTTFVIR
ncbi:MAG TPA: hypothetical protein VG873_12830 [Burkholderiales bacterium]|nr:hypothetical protein [Burkholderiales bacterium]